MGSQEEKEEVSNDHLPTVCPICGEAPTTDYKKARFRSLGLCSPECEEEWTNREEVVQDAKEGALRDDIKVAKMIKKRGMLH